MEREQILIKESVQGNEQSFAELINTYKNYVFAIILNFIKDYDEVENVAQEVFLQIYISLPQYEQDNLKGWIGRIASNKSIDWLRRKRSKFKEETLENSEEIIDKLGANQKDNPELLLIEKENKENLKRALDSIPDIYRITIEKFYFQGKSYEEIAAEENITVKAVASRLYRGKNILKEKWRERNETL